MQEVGRQDLTPADTGFCEWLEAVFFKAGYGLLAVEMPQAGRAMRSARRRWTERADTLAAKVFAEGADLDGRAPFA